MTDMTSLAQRLAEALRGDGQIVFTGGRLYRSELGLWHEVPIAEQREACSALIGPEDASRAEDICELMRLLATNEGLFERRRGGSQ